MRRGSVGDPHFDVFFVRANALQRALVADVSDAELDGRIAHAGLLKLVQL